MAPSAEMWCFDVDAKFERNGVTSSNTLKCVSRPFRPSDDDATGVRRRRESFV